MDSMNLSRMSILETVKKVLNLDKDYTAFDLDVVTHINSCFSTLHQIGVGPTSGYEIDGYEEKWSDYTDDKVLNEVRSFIIDNVRLRFDPPATSFAIAAIQERIKESTWRLNVAAERSGNYD